jgi:hypothetical protein
MVTGKSRSGRLHRPGGAPQRPNGQLLKRHDIPPVLRSPHRTAGARSRTRARGPGDGSADPPPAARRLFPIGKSYATPPRTLPRRARPHIAPPSGDAIVLARKPPAENAPEAGKWLGEPSDAARIRDPASLAPSQYLARPFSRRYRYRPCHPQLLHLPDLGRIKWHVGQTLRAGGGSARRRARSRFSASCWGRAGRPPSAGNVAPKCW